MSDSTIWQGTNYDQSLNTEASTPFDCGILGSILVVDDDIAMLRSVMDLLGAFGYQCQSAETGMKALEILQEQSIDLVLLDLNMPNVNGFQVLKELREINHPADVIILSGEHCFDDAVRAMEYGVRNFLRKPYMPSELLAAINKTADVRRVNRSHQLREHKLEKAVNRNDFIVNNSPDIIFMLDTQGCFSFINQRAESLLGYSHEELIGMHFSVLVHPDDLPMVQHSFQERRTGKRASQHVELNMLPRQNFNIDGAEVQLISAELSSMGIYAGKSDKTFVGTYGVLRDIRERKRTEKMMNYQIHHDLLTELPNRALFKDRLQIAIAQAKRSNAQLAVMYMDLDRFKIINDSLGHLVGDQLLQAVARRLKNCLRTSDTLARVGGDEFNLLLPNINNAEDASIIAQKILSELEQPIIVDGIELYISFSIGIAIYPDNGNTIDTLIKHADTAMYSVKENGKKNFEFYHDGMQTKHVRHITLEQDLRSAMNGNQLRVYYQPLVDVETGKTASVEALMRWEHPLDGLVLPQTFIELSEETGLIIEMGQWLLNEACRTVKNWWQTHPGLKLSINVSSRELLQHDYADRLLSILNQNDFPGEMLILEISEAVLLKDMENNVNTLKKLSNMGVQIAIDNFGSGYSSLSYIQTLPLHVLKIDRSFIEKIKSKDDSSTILFAIVSMAKGLGLSIVAEGVETEEQLNFLKKIGCNNAQGFYLSRPQPAEQLSQQFIAQSA